jgi:manganese/zinc/iron transport system permease protein
MIVLVCAVLFAFSMVFGSKRGLLIRVLRRRRLNQRIARQHLLRGIYELVEERQNISLSSDRPTVEIDRLLRLRSWQKSKLLKVVRRAERDEMVQWRKGKVQLTHAGLAEAARLTRQHRLWELYLVNYADVAPARVDRDADAIEHVLEPELVDELESLLDQQPLQLEVPGNPHAVQGTSA